MVIPTLGTPGRQLVIDDLATSLVSNFGSDGSIPRSGVERSYHRTVSDSVQVSDNDGGSHIEISYRDETVHESMAKLFDAVAGSRDAITGADITGYVSDQFDASAGSIPKDGVLIGAELTAFSERFGADGVE
ncbi:MAG: hypothetical protein JWO69_1290 [Thermoleophilia bacterium]|jgi:hypothetical protein|nr:hypothetical protein [Thermoleophilia bacterium]